MQETTGHGNNHFIDLRSDTVTKPTNTMRQAMASAEVGDDVYGEDPTVNRLESMTAKLLGKEAALYVSSGTMGNLTAVLAHCGRGDEIILGDRCHIFRSEQGGAAALGGVHPMAIRNQPDGTLDLDEVAANIRGDNEHYPITKVISIENTHNFCGGRVLSLDYMDAIGDLAHQHGLKLHVDGARIWNAAVALNVAPARLLQNADTASVCLSKGLGAPVGSLVVGDKAFIAKARRARKAAGGGMRQAGIIAAAGVVAITEMIERLADDHANAKALANGLHTLEGIAITPDEVETNLVFFDLTRDDMTPTQLVNGLAAHGVKLSASGGRRLRAVLNHHVTEAHVTEVLSAFRTVLAGDPVVDGAQVATYG